jgi:hypothetical protein
MERGRNPPHALIGALIPGAAFVVLLVTASRTDARFAWVARPWTAPWPIFAIAIAGTIGLAGTVSDFVYHRRKPAPIVGPLEHRAHVLALFTGGVPLFAIMAAATLASNAMRLLVPVIVVAMSVVLWVAYDEYVFHRRRQCAPVEETFHLMANLGNAAAFLAWVQWVFVEGV